MFKIAKAVRMGIAAAAVAVAASVVSIAPAQALPAAPMIVGTMGTSATTTVTTCPSGTMGCVSSSGVTTSAAPSTPIYFYFGPANPNPAPKTTILTFTPVPLIPGFLLPLYGWFTKDLNIELCVLGLSAKIGSYGTLTTAIGSSC